MAVLASSKPRRLSALAACRRLQCTEHTLLKHVVCGRLKAIVEPGNAVKYDRDEVERFAAELGIPAPAEAVSR